MGNRVTAASFISIMLAALVAAFLFNPQPAAAARNDSRVGPASFAFSLIDQVTQRLCDRQKSLGNRLRIPLVNPAKCNQAPPDAEPTVTLTADPTSISAGESTTLTWTSEDAVSCEAFLGWSGTKALNGSQSVSPTETTTYQLDCTGPGGVGSDDATVTVVVEEPDEPTVEITADPMTITAGASSTLTWNSDNADTCTASNGWSGGKVVDGTQSVAPAQTTTYAISCTGDGGTANDSVTVTVNQAEPEEGTLIVRKVLIRDNGSTAATTSFSFTVNAGGAVSFEADGENSIPVDAGTYSVVETAATGFTTSYNNCSNVAVADGETETCTITNNDNAPETGTLVVRKVVIRDNGGTAATTSFSFQVDGNAAVAFEADAENSMSVSVGTHSVVEVAASGYTTTYDNCTDVAVANGETETCVITNNDVAGVPDTATLTLVKVVLNNSEGGVDAVATEWTLSADGPTDISGVTGNAAVTNATVDVGTYTLSESNGPSGYTASSFVCQKNDGPDVIGNSITLVDGDDATCTITNDDNAQQGGVNHLLISEVYYDVSNSTTTNIRGEENTNEWFELYNP
ncbi:MAG: hypothetical protein WA021_03765, partial [Minisyncoccia bacterium]